MTADDLLAQIRFSRRYTTALLDETPTDGWFRFAPEGASHVAWQVGHLALSVYRLGLFRLRGARPDDPPLGSEQMVAAFGRTSVPAPAATTPFTAEQLRALYEQAHDLLERDWDEVAAAARLDAPPEGPPHRHFSTRGGCLAWCAQHELIHAGQVGLLRRQLGLAPRW